MNVALLGIGFYKNWVSPFLHRLGVVPMACRYPVTCSEYAEIVIKKHGLLKGGKIAIVRLLSCHP